jgi:hypothetical protein
VIKLVKVKRGRACSMLKDKNACKICVVETNWNLATTYNPYVSEEIILKLVLE